MLEGALRIDQVAINSGCKTYRANGKLVTHVQSTPGYSNNTNNNQGPKILNTNLGVTIDGVTNQPKNPSVVNPIGTGATNNNKNGNNKRNNNLSPSVNAMDFNHPQQH